MEVWLQGFLPSALFGDEWFILHPGDLTAEQKRPSNVSGMQWRAVMKVNNRIIWQ
jgi:hypothetical protein